jgi:hypothetical protein
LQLSRNGVVTLNNWNYSKWRLFDYLGKVFNFYPNKAS